MINGKHTDENFTKFVFVNLKNANALRDYHKGSLTENGIRARLLVCNAIWCPSVRNLAIYYVCVVSFYVSTLEYVYVIHLVKSCFQENSAI
jgi:hypothetical protein